MEKLIIPKTIIGIIKQLAQKEKTTLTEVMIEERMATYAELLKARKVMENMGLVSSEKVSKHVYIRFTNKGIEFYKCVKKLMELMGNGNVLPEM